MFLSAVAVTPDGKKVYVANNIDQSVSVIDTATNNVVATVTVGIRPTTVTIIPDGTQANVTNADGTVSVINTATDTIT